MKNNPKPKPPLLYIATSYVELWRIMFFIYIN